MARDYRGGPPRLLEPRHCWHCWTNSSMVCLGGLSSGLQNWLMLLNLSTTALQATSSCLAAVTVWSVVQVVQALQNRASVQQLGPSSPQLVKATGNIATIPSITTTSSRRRIAGNLAARVGGNKEGVSALP
jgi:hypothetical protein